LSDVPGRFGEICGYVLPVLTPRDAMWRRGGSRVAAGHREPRSSSAEHSAQPFVLPTGGSPSSGYRNLSIRMPALTGGASAPRTRTVGSTDKHWSATAAPGWPPLVERQPVSASRHVL